MTIESLIRQPRPWLQRRFAASTAGAKTAIGGGTAKIILGMEITKKLK